MGCKISSSSESSSQEQESERAGSSEHSSLLPASLANGNGYGIERLSDDSPSPEWKPLPADGGGENNAASAAPDQHTAFPAKTADVSPQEQRRIRTEVHRSSRGSSGSLSEGSGSQGRYTEPLPGRAALRVASSNRYWRAGGGQEASDVPRGLARTPAYLDQMNQQNLKLTGPAEADGIIRVPGQAPPPSLYSGVPASMTQRGKETMEQLSKAYRWREQFAEPTSEFLALMDRLYMECQLHLTALSSRGDQESRREADTIVSEMVALRNYWGPRLLPSSTCNAFVRERIPLTLGVDQRQFRIDCAQFFEPVPFYGNQQSSCPGELMKLYRFSVYNMTSNEVVLRYYLERSNVIQLYHVLCFTCENYRGQVRPYGTEPPTYWEVRQNMLEDVCTRLLSGISPGKYQAPKPRSIYPANTMGRPAHLQVMPVAGTT